ncbi:MAG: cation:proton antiporter [Robiginitomaculum sp.]|nr:MAG: cation:proton antiporter [Robiginitomaculum sp.]
MSWTPELGLILLLAIPLGGGIGVLAFSRWPNLRETATLLSGVLLLANVTALVMAVDGGARPSIDLMGMAGGMTLNLTLEPLGAVFAALASALWLINSLYSIGYMRGNKAKDQTRFYFSFTIAIAAAMGVAASGNMITLFIFYEALTLSTYPLVAHNGDEKARRGARIYLTILMGTSVGLFLPAVIITHVLAGSTDFTPGGLLAGNITTGLGSILLILYVFGIGKAAIMPVHNWLPNAMVAPTPVSAFLHAVAVVKAGVFTMLKMSVYVFGLDLMRELPASHWLAWIAAISIVLASLMAMAKDNLKERLAYSTISQLSYITLGAMIATPMAALGAAVHIIMHAWGKITLFMCAGAIYTARHITEVSGMKGLGKSLPWVFGAFLVGSLSIIGLPPLAGAWPKLMLMMGSTDPANRVFIGALIISSLLNVAYLLPISINAFFAEPLDKKAKPPKAPVLTVIPPLITAAGTIVLFFAIGPILDFLRPVFESGGLS